LLSYENEALFLERSGEPVEHHTPATTFKIENPLAVLRSAKDPAAAKAFNDFQYTRAGQTAWAQAGFRPVDPQVGASFATVFPAPAKLWTIDDLGGWPAVDAALFDPSHGSIATIYDAATR
jgi:sulfate transport system substrate-binding protein